MATPATNTVETKEISVEERLKALYKLQTVVTEIDKIRNILGELPREIQDLEDEIAGLQTRITNTTSDLEEISQLLASKKVEIEEAKVKIEKSTEQQNNIRNNREYDALSKEIEFQTLSIESCEKDITKLSEKQEVKKAEYAEAQERLNNRQQDLEQKIKEKDEIAIETKQAEERLMEEQQEVEKLIDPYYLNAFKRIRKNARNGLAVVTVERDACGGCFNKIPPQKQLDIRSRKKVIPCEYCGRILVDKDIAEETKI